MHNLDRAFQIELVILYEIVMNICWSMSNSIDIDYIPCVTFKGFIYVIGHWVVFQC